MCSLPGVLLRRLVADPALKGVSHVIVDEIHERGINEVHAACLFWQTGAMNPDASAVQMFDSNVGFERLGKEGARHSTLLARIFC